MRFYGQLLLDPLCDALALLALAYALGLLARRWPRLTVWSRVLPALAGAVLLVFSLPAVANRMSRSLETPVLTSIKPDVTYDAVIVLGGSMEGPATADTGAPQFNETVERVLTGFDLLRTGRAKFAILSGTSWGAGTPEPESRLVAKQYEAWGIDPARIATDEISRSTYQNAVESVRIARERGWTHDVLVTSAAHMKRALGCFRHEGLDVDTLSVDFVSYDPAKHGHGWIPHTATLKQSVDAIHEIVGRVAYGARGWMD